MNERNYMNNLHQMTDEQLKERYSTNKKRIVGNNAFLGAITIASLFAFPPAVVATLGVGAFRTYFINKNNKSIEKEVEERGMLLKKTRK